MPRYEFLCETCQTPFELIMTIAERETTKLTCPKCKGDNPSKGKPSVMPEKASAMTETLRAMEGSIACRVVGVRTQK